MLKNHNLASAIADGGFYEFRRQLEYKCDWYGSQLTLIDQWYPSSQICSNCGHRQKMPLNQRTYDCPNCGISIDRDLNAAINLEVRP
jgi:putative transposase